MAVLTNTMLQGSSAVEDEEGHQIERSLKFDRNELDILERQFDTSNRRIWTWAGWVKRNSITLSGTLHQTIFSAKNANTQIRFHTDDDTLDVLFNGSSSGHLRTTQKFRDISAWTHIVLAVDTTQAIPAERVKLYVNGSRVTALGTETYPSQYYETGVNSETIHCIGRSAADGNRHLDGYLADVHFYDGLQLSPAAFGGFDSTKAFNPKKTTDADGDYILPTVNNGTTWSSSVTTESGSFHGDGPAVNLFDGKLTTQVFNSAAGGWEKFSPSGGISYNQSVEVYRGGTVNTTTSNSISDFTITDADGSVITKNFGNSTGTWDLLVEGKGKFTEIKCDPEAGDWGYWGGIRVDGVVLHDGVNDEDISLYKVGNVSKTWSSEGFSVSGGSYYDSGRTPTAMFDGDSSTECLAPDGQNVTWKPVGGLKARDKIELQMTVSTSSGTTSTFTVNGVDKRAAAVTALGANTQGWYDIGKEITEADGIVWGRVAGGNDAEINQVRVDGYVLRDLTDNSFHLKFNDTTNLQSLGKSSISSGRKVTDATGAKPILVATDDYGVTTAGTVDTSDSNKSNLVLAIPGRGGIADVHHTVKGSGSAKTTTSMVVNSTTMESKLYGQSLYFPVNNSTAFSCGDSDDWDFDGDYCVEGWFFPKNESGYVPLIAARNTAGWRLQFTPQDNWKVKWGGGTGDGEVAVSPANAIHANRWWHIAATRAGSTVRLFINGTQVASGTDSTAWNAGANLELGDTWPSGMSMYHGFMNDIRVYKGAAKYTSNFTVPSSPHFTALQGISTTATSTLTGDTTITVSGGATMIIKAAGDQPVTGSFNASDGTHGNINYIWSEDGITWNFIIQDQDTGPTLTARWLGFAGGGNNTRQFTSSKGSYYYSGAGSTSLDSHLGWPKTVDQTGLTFTGTTTKAGIDTSVDSPTNFEPTGGDTGAGGTVQGNYCVLNPLKKGSSITLSNGNLTLASSGSHGQAFGTIGISSGKWYWEFETTSSYLAAGVALDNSQVISNAMGDHAGAWGYVSNGSSSTKQSGDAAHVSYGSACASGDVIGVAFDADNGTLTFYKNGSSMGVAYSSMDTDLTYFPVFGDSTSAGNPSGTANFGQRAFEDAAPAEHTCLCTQNLGDFSSGSSKNNPKYFFDINLYTGAGTGNTTTFSDMKFGPDLIWGKARSYADPHGMCDVVRGASNLLIPSSTAAPATTSGSHVTAFASDGYTLGNGVNFNGSSTTYVNWCWDAGPAAATASGDGTVTPTTQWVNATAGFSISKLTTPSSGTGYNFGHALAEKPDLVIAKELESSLGWYVWHNGLAKNGYVLLNSNNAANTGATVWNDTAHDNSIVHDRASGHWGNDVDMLYYVWTAIPGYSSFGTYEGNGSSVGPYINTGFKVRYLLTKNIDATANWRITDTDRADAPFGNPQDQKLYTDGDWTEGSGDQIWLFSNGFKILDSDAGFNSNGDTFLYMAFAEHPLKTARAR